jgi:hypothetical protein
MGTLLRQEILRGKHFREGGVSPHDWLHVIIALLCHDMGYVRGVCREDGDGYYILHHGHRGPSRGPGARQHGCR